MSSYEKFHDTSLPPKDGFYSKLDNEHISNEDYDRACKVWKTMNINNLGEYHDLYLTTDVLLLADVFENFRTSAIKNYQLDPTHYLTLPGFAWDALLLMTGAKLDVLSDPDMYLMVERGQRGGISVISHRHAKANNKYMKNYDSSKPSQYIIYLDANNLYGWAISQYLPVGNYTWANANDFDAEKIIRMTDEQETGYIFDVDLHYPTELHDLHNDYPLAPETMEITENLLSDHSKNVLDIIQSKHNKCQKLTPNLFDKKNYVVHYRNLKFYLEQGLKLVKINKVISFTQKPWMKEYIDFNTTKRASTSVDFEKDMYKLMNNAVFGKTMENVRNRIRFELVNTEKRHSKLLNDPTFTDSVKLNDSLYGVSRSKTEVHLDKPIPIGFSVLELSKILMYSFHYNHIKKSYGNKAKLLFTDTDSLTYVIETDDIYDDMLKNSDMYDFSEYDKKHKCFDDSNKKVIGKFKDETNGKPIIEFVGLKSKMYAIKTEKNESKKAKGVKKSVVKRELHFSDYYNSLMGETKDQIQQTATFNTFRSYKQDLYSVKLTKIGLNAHDDKRYIIDGINTYAHGHYKIIKH